MADDLIHQQQHGYKNGHQLLAGSIKLSSSDQDLVDRLSDLAGTLRPGETFEPYLTGYPLPSRKYYVLARSWQDFDAPRSGCVLTRSLFVPMEIWEGASCIPSLVALLRPINRLIEDKSPLVLSQLGESMPPVSDPRVSELVEALFLEHRQPIVMFDVPEAEIIAERLLTAFWPGLRSGFSVSTFALAPRTIGGQTFDLLFAPKTARSRFSDWKGRRIDAVLESPKLSRHRWTNSTTQKIFISDEPSFLTSDFLGILGNNGDESAFRLSLLWGELLDKSEKSPNAVLGMLDILNSQNSAFGDRLLWITQHIERSIKLAESSLPGSETWDFMATLLGKFSDRQPPTGIRRQLRRTSVTLALNEPEIALQFLKRYDVVNQPVPSVLLAGLASGLTRSANIESMADKILQFRPSMILRLIAYSSSFAKHMVREATVGRWINELNDLLDITDDKLRSRVRRNIVPELDNPMQAPLIRSLLKGIDSKALLFVISKIWEKTRFEIEEFDEPLCLSAQDEEQLDNLRVSIASVDETSASNRFLLRTIRLTSSDIEWLCDSTLIGRERVVHLLNAFFNQYDDYSIKSIASNIKTRDLILTKLLMDLKPSAILVARLLMLGQFPLRQFQDIGLQVLPYINGQMRSEMISKLLERGLKEASAAEEDLLEKTLIIAVKTIDTSQLIVMATPFNVTDARISSNVLLLSRLTGVIRKDILARVDELTDRLIHRINAAFGASAIIAWASMIEESGEIDKKAQLRAAGAALPYALSLLNAPVSPLIMASFPLIYIELRAGKEPPGLSGRFSFFDWDRCKDARRELVKAYLKSSWPPTDLLLVASLAGDGERILEHLVRQYNGKQYLIAIEDGLKRLPLETKKRLIGEFKAFNIGVLQSVKWDE